MGSRLMLHEELCKILGSKNVYFNTPESVKMQYPAIRYSLNALDNRSAGNEVYIQHPSYSVILIDRDPDSPIAKKLSVLSGCRLSRPPYPANGLYHFPFTLKTTKGNVTEVLDEYYNKGCADTEKKYEDVPGMIENAYDKGFEDGKDSVVDWCELAENIEFSSLNVFEKSVVVLDLKNISNFSDLFYIGDKSNVNTTVEHLTINSNQFAKSLERMFYCNTNCNDKTLKRLTLNFSTEKTTTVYRAFRSLNALEIIDGIPLDLSNCTNVTDFFRDCTAIKEVRFKENTIKISIYIGATTKLSAETIQSIIDGLADLTGQTTRTLDFHSDIIAKLTDEQWTQIYNKNWTAI